ncbi:TatD family hydrolase [Lysinibacillus capsici]|uniref:TatD family hydrolase n=1 Tax=Lysinibacillus capsici TaxID=2115968 RepID=UPI0001DA59CC|nr:TatD family hydrolase [Lysinibacillus capsici]EFI69010.1 TatD-related deoxyribonuclease [Lysinibacillus fusiformis ZC1]MBU5254022.1 TatD family hydrolase [Lysinibacillus capsici]MED4701300.1 TatD family hydrolase [Lysinibacillus capsici]
MLIDAHIHLDQYTDEEIPSLLEEVKAVIAVSMQLSSCERTLRLSKSYQQVKAAFGFHPEQPLLSPNDETALFDWIRSHQDDMVAIGEVGLPYYLRQEQGIDERPYVALLERFVVLAKELDKPIVLHAVYEDAHVVCDLLEKHQLHEAHFHWFKGDEAIVKRMIERGYFISITPDCLYEEEIQQLIDAYPIDLMMVETDGPWPFEGPFTKKRTSPWMMHSTIEMIASIKGLSTQEAAKIITQNTKTFYRL